MHDAIVVGAGTSGLLTALALSNEGKKVLVLEKNDFVGGNVRTYKVGDYTVDTGPHAVTHIHDGPLRELMDRYFKTKPEFVPYGNYYVRTKDKFSVFPWTVQAWVNFDILPRSDRLRLTKVIASTMVSSAFGRTNLQKSLYDTLNQYRFSEKTWKFIDALSYFMSGKSMKRIPAWRMLKGARYIEENEEKYIMDRILGKVAKFKKLVSYNGVYHQAYPKQGIGIITDSIVKSFKKGNVEIRTGEEVDHLIDNKGKITGVSTENDNFKSDFVVYSAPVKDLPKLTGILPTSYEKNLNRLEQSTSITVWLGLKKKLLEYRGSEIWFESGKPFWAMPISNYNSKFAPKGKQVVGFASFVEKDPQKEEKALLDTIYSAHPQIEKNVEMRHVQFTNPEKAAITIDATFPAPKSPLEGLYLVGTDTDPRSMGITRAAFSVLDMLDILKKEKRI